MRIGALDLGSNSFHLLVADVRSDGTFVPVAREKEVLRLGDEVSRHGCIPDDAAGRAVAAARRLTRLAAAHGSQEIIAKATSAIRTATNGSAVVDAIEEATGLDVDVIDGITEAALVFAAVRASVVLDPPPALCLDLGGGSVEIMVGDASGLLFATSENLGVGRLTAELLRAGPPVENEPALLEARVRESLELVAARVERFEPRVLVGSSGTLCDLARLAHATRTGEVPATTNGLRITRDDASCLHERIVAASAAERRRLPGIDAKRADLLPAGSAFLGVALEMFGFAEMVVSDWALREGIVLEALRSHDPDDWSDDPRALRRASVAGLARRCSSDTDHTVHVARLARSLFDQTTALHRLGPGDREMLEYAVMLHDIGQHVSRQGHHRHAAYLVENGSLRGFSPEEVAFLAALVRHHRRGDPKATDERMATLSPGERERLRWLAAVLRLADGLDRGRRGAVEDVAVQVAGSLVILRLRTRGDAELELWGARRKRDLFEKVTRRDVELVASRAEPPTAPDHEADPAS